MTLCFKRYVALLAVTLLTATGAAGAEITVMSAAALGAFLKETSATFEKEAGHKVTIKLGPAGALKKQFEEGAATDIIVVTAAGIEDLSKQSKIVAKKDLAKVGMAVGVRKGETAPDVSSPDAFKKMLLDAKTIARGDPGNGGAGSVHVAKVIQLLGIENEVKGKSKLSAGAGIATLVAKGEADVALGQNSELMGVDGVQIIGPFPGNLQNISVFSAGVSSSSSQSEAAKAFLDHLSKPASLAVLMSKGMDPGQ